jgi:hypothetical protein
MAVLGAARRPRRIAESYRTVKFLLDAATIPAYSRRVLAMPRPTP